MTFTWTEILLALVTISFILVAVQLARTLGRVGSSVSEIERVVGQLEPRMGRLIEDASAVLRESRSVIGRLDGVGADAASISGEATRVLVPLIRDLNGVRQSTRRLAATAVAVRTGFAALTRL